VQVVVAGDLSAGVTNPVTIAGDVGTGVVGTYHGQLVQPACAVAAAGFFARF